jgi:hypothetical protein
MIKYLAIQIALCTASCLQAKSSDSQVGAAQQLPTKFTLNCGVPKGSSIPAGTERGFKIIVDRASNQFSFSWDRLGPWPIEKIGPEAITFVDAHVEHGIDGNPEDRRITFDRRAGVLQFHEAYAGFVPVEHTFSSRCEIADA